MTGPELTLCDSLVQQVAAQEIAPAEALTTLTRYGLTADRETLSEAVGALMLRDRFLAFEGDPVAFTGVDFRPGVSVWDLAVELAEDALESALRVLAAPGLVATA